MRWVSKDVKILVAPSAVGELQAVKDGCKLWENEGFGFSFDVQLADHEYSLGNFPSPPAESVGVINQPSGNPDAGKWNQAFTGNTAQFAFDTGLIRIPSGFPAFVVAHELWHILVSGNEPIDEPPFEPLMRMAVAYIWSHQPGDII